MVMPDLKRGRLMIDRIRILLLQTDDRRHCDRLIDLLDIIGLEAGHNLFRVSYTD